MEDHEALEGNVENKTPIASEPRPVGTPENSLETISSSNESPVVVPQIRPEPATPERKPSVRTYYSDIDESIKNQKESLSSIAVQEQLRKEKTTVAEESPKRRKSFLFYILALVFVLLGGAALYGVYFIFTRTEELPPITTPNTHFIDVENIEELEIGTLLSGEIKKLLKEKIVLYGQSGVIAIVPTEEQRPLISREFIETLDTHIDGPLLRSFEDEYVIGANSGGAFMIFKISFYENAFPGMLRLEPYLEDDFSFLVQDPGTGSIVTSEQGASHVLVPGGFKDAIVYNQDVRILLNNDGSERVLYGFPDTEHLVISGNGASFQKAIDLLKQVRFESGDL